MYTLLSLSINRNVLTEMWDVDRQLKQDKLLDNLRGKLL
jgi:hypothetical protein